MDFPIESLPENAKNAIKAQAALGNYRIEAVGSAALAIMSLAAQGLFDIEDPSQQDKAYPTSQYFMVLMDSGDAKSSVYQKLMVGHNRWQMDAEEKYNSLKVRYDIAAEAHEQKLKDTKKLGPISREEVANEAPIKPRHPRNLASKTTTNGLFALLDRGWPSFGLFSDEAGTLLTGHSLKAENGPAEFASTLTGLWDQGRADRTTAEISQYLTGKRLSALLMVQPVVANDFLKNRVLAEQGIHARIHIVRSPKWVPIKADFSCPKEIARRAALAGTVAAFNNRIEGLLTTPLPMFKDGVLEPCRIGWSPCAKAAAVAINHACLDRRDQQTEGYWQRLWEHVCRMAGVLTAFEGQHEVTTDILNSAWELVQFYASQWSALDLDVGSESDRRLEPYKAKVLKVLKSETKGLTARELSRNALRGVDGSIRDRVLKELVDDEYLNMDEVISGTRTKLIYKSI